MRRDEAKLICFMWLSQALIVSYGENGVMDIMMLDPIFSPVFCGCGVVNQEKIRKRWTVKCTDKGSVA
jgi:hypothetical protein